MSDAISETVIEAPQISFLDRAGLRGFPWVPAIVLYTISWGWLLIVGDSYWIDDWIFFKFRGLVYFDLESMGFAPWMEINTILLNFFGPGFMRLLIFLSFFVSSIFVFGVTFKFLFLNLWQRQVFALFFLVLPINTARVALMNFHYTTALVMFFIAWYLLLFGKTQLMRGATLLLFFLSFQMFTLIVFFILPILSLFYVSRVRGLKGASNLLRKNIALVSLPVLYWIARGLFWPGSTEYHSLTQNKITSAIVFTAFSIMVFLLLLSLVLCSKGEFKASFKILLTGYLVAFVGLIVYVIFGLVGYGSKIPITYLVVLFGRSDWFSRHQTLQPLGLSLILIGVIGLLPKFMRKVEPHFVGLFLAVAVIFNIGFGFEYVVDYKKQMEVIRVLKLDVNLTLSDEIQITDRTQFLNARQRSYRDRDWLGLVALAKGAESAEKLSVRTECSVNGESPLILINGPDTHWQALKNWVSDGEMGFEVTVDDTPGACKPELMQGEIVSGAIPILFYFTGAKN